MIFLLEDDSQVAVLNESAPSTVNFVQQSRQIPPPLNQASLKNASDKAKLYVSLNSLLTCDVDVVIYIDYFLVCGCVFRYRRNDSQST